MQSKLVHSNVVMSGQVLHLLRVIIRVVNFDFELLLLLEVEVCHDLDDELWVEVVMDNLSFTLEIPLAVCQFVEHAEWI